MSETLENPVPLIKKMKLRSDGGLDVSIQYQHSEEVWIENISKSPLAYGAEISKLIDRLKIHILLVFDIFSSKEININKKLPEQVKEYLDNRVEVTGVVFENKGGVCTGVQLLAVLETRVRKDAAVNTPMIDFANDQYADMQELEDTCRELRAAIGEYISKKVRIVQMELEMA